MRSKLKRRRVDGALGAKSNKEKVDDVLGVEIRIKTKRVEGKLGVEVVKEKG